MLSSQCLIFNQAVRRFDLSKDCRIDQKQSILIEAAFEENNYRLLPQSFTCPTERQPLSAHPCQQKRKLVKSIPQEGVNNKKSFVMFAVVFVPNSSLSMIIILVSLTLQLLIHEVCNDCQVGRTVKSTPTLSCPPMDTCVWGSSVSSGI